MQGLKKEEVVSEDVCRLFVPPPAMFFPVGVVLAYNKDDVRPVHDPECAHKACKCSLRAETSEQWGMFAEKLHQVVSCSVMSLRGEMPTLKVVSEQNAQVQLLDISRTRFGDVRVHNKFSLV